MRHMATRFAISEAEVYACTQRIDELNIGIEKELITDPVLNASLSAQYEKFLEEVEPALMQPIAQELEKVFWTQGTDTAQPTDPQQLVFLLDRKLWSLPFERFPCFTRLFGGSSGALTRDLSFHALAQRREDERRPLQLSSTAMLTDTYSEDTLRSNDNPRSETMCTLHKRIIEATDQKPLDKDRRSLSGKMFKASPQDISGILADTSALLCLGFGSFFTTMPAKLFASLAMPHVSLLAVFHRAYNDKAFRRQTKAASGKTVAQMKLENPYGTALVAAFRGIRCFLHAAAPVPVSLCLRVSEAFIRAFREGKSVAKSLEAALEQKADPEQRYVRRLADEVTGTAGSKASGKDKNPSTNASPEPAAPLEDLLPAHTRAAFVLVGVPWLQADGDVGGAGKKK